MWLEAAGQIFFSLSIGFGIIINYASYLREKTIVALSGLTACSRNEFFEVGLGGLITMPAAFVFLGGRGAAVSGSSFALGFQALPSVRPHAGRAAGRLPVVLHAVPGGGDQQRVDAPAGDRVAGRGLGPEAARLGRRAGIGCALGCGFIVFFSKGLMALDTFDFWVGSVRIFVLAIVQAILFGWIFGIRRGDAELHQGRISASRGSCNGCSST